MIKKLLQSGKLLFHLIKEHHFLSIYCQSFVLQSIPKSGTNYFRLLMANYLNNLPRNPEEFEEIEYDQMHYTLFPNAIDDIFDYSSKYQTPKNDLVKQGSICYADFLYAHYSLLFYVPAFISKRIAPQKTILLYRNPLDYLISRFHYNYKNRIGNEELYSHPREVIDELIGDYIRIYSRLEKYNKIHPQKSLMVSYEELKLSPQKTMQKVLLFLEFPINENVIDFAIESSSINKVRRTEEKRGGAIHTPDEGLKGSFVRSGKIGQWKDYLEDRDTARIIQLLKSAGINLDQFITS